MSHQKNAEHSGQDADGPNAILSPTEAQSILAKNVANIVKKAAAGKTLSPKEVALIAQFSDAPNAAHREWVTSYEELAKVFGCHHHSFPRWKKDFADAPKPRHNGGHSVSAWRRFFAVHPEIDLQVEAGTIKSSLQIEILRQQCRAITFDNDKAEGAYVLKSEIGPALRNISLNQRACLLRKLEQELPTKLVGLTTIEILAHMRAAVDEICAIFRNDTKRWAEAPPAASTDDSEFSI